jgi:hypothetical protein
MTNTKHHTHHREKVLRGNRAEGEGSSGANPNAAPQRYSDAEKNVTIAELTPQRYCLLL